MRVSLLRPLAIRSPIAKDATRHDLMIDDVTVIDTTRNFWDKVLTSHGLPR